MLILQENRKTNKTLKSCIHYNMAFIGGMFSAFAVLDFGRLASAQTNNLIELVIYLLGGNISQTLLRLAVLIIYSGALVMTTWIPKHTRWNLRLISLMIDALAAVIMAFYFEASDPYILLIPSFFAMAFQWGCFSELDGFGCSTIFSTNNTKQFVSSLTEIYLNKDDSYRPKAKIYGFTLLFFHFGVVFLTIVWLLFSHKAMLFVIIPLVTATPMIVKDT